MPVPIVAKDMVPEFVSDAVAELSVSETPCVAFTPVKSLLKVIVPEFESDEEPARTRLYWTVASAVGASDWKVPPLVKVTSVRVVVRPWRMVPAGLEIEPPVTLTGPLMSAMKSVPLPTVRSTPPVFVSVYPLAPPLVVRSRRFDPAVASIVPLLTIVPAEEWIEMRRSPLLPPDEIVPALSKTVWAGVAASTLGVLLVVSFDARVSVNPEAIVKPPIEGFEFSTTGVPPLSDPLMSAASEVRSGMFELDQLLAVFQPPFAAPCQVRVVSCA
jgi:hypothetical protein